jgi:tetratricopeptide (TPR) repeat protein
MQAQTSESEVEAAETIWRGKISDEEIRAYERASAEFKDRGDEKGAAKILGQLGILYHRRGEWDLAIKYYKKSMKIFETLEDQHGLAQTYNNLGNVYADKGEWDLAIKYCEKDMEISETLGDRHGLAQTYNNLGLVYTNKGEWDIAIEYYEKSVEIKEALGDQHGLAKTYNNLGLVYADKGEWDLAIEYYEKDMEISEALGDRHGVGITLSNIGKGYLDRSDPVEAKSNIEEAIKKIHPDARPHYPNALNWLAASLRMIADQKKCDAKMASSDVDRKKLVSDAAELYREAGERYEETHGLPLARMPRSLMMDAHLTRGLSYSVQNITEEDADKAIELLDSAITEMEAALEFADGADAIRLEGAIASHKAKMCVREIDLHREDAKERDRLLGDAIDYLGEASESFGSLGETGACSSKTCDGCRHLYTALGLIRDGYREESNQKIVDAVSEIRLAGKCYQSISNELGMEVVGRVNEILRRVADNLKNAKGFDPGGAVDAANNVFDALDEIAGVGLRNMIKILVFDEAGNVTERKAPKAGQIATDGGINISIDNTRGDIDIHHTGYTTEMNKEPPPEKQKSVSRWDIILGAISGFSVDAIAIILMHYYFEESVKSHPILLVTIFVITLFATIFIRHKISKS